jgi:hypothetical protein
MLSACLAQLVAAARHRAHSHYCKARKGRGGMGEVEWARHLNFMSMTTPVNRLRFRLASVRVLGRIQPHVNADSRE